MASDFEPKTREDTDAMEGIELADNDVETSLQAMQADTTTVVSPIEQEMNVVSQVEVGQDTNRSCDEKQIPTSSIKIEVKQETYSSHDTTLHNIPHHTSSSTSQPTNNLVKAETASPPPLLNEAEQSTIRSRQSSHSTEVAEFDFENVRDVARSMDLAKLEAGVSLGLALLHELQAPLADAKEQSLLNTIEDLKKKSKPGRTMIAVAGSTGAGKSSLINAVLSEEKLLPTSGMRACTAVVTEISYNHDEDSSNPYRAEVEFISSDEWASELEILFAELISDEPQGFTRHGGNTEADIAYAKIRAVYPNMTLEALGKSSIEQCMERHQVQRVLGTTETLSFRKASELCKALHVYLDSKERHPRETANKDGCDFAFWPLIKVVRIYCRADALSTGACIVDLPGIHDSNPARSAVAKRYMAECSAIWIASPIKRAVDDKAATDLLGQSSRTQLKMDGMYSNVTFICTSSDMFEVDEIRDCLDFDSLIKARMDREVELGALIAKTADRIKELEDKVGESDVKCDGLEESLREWERISEQFEKGQMVFAPSHVKSARTLKRRKQTSLQADMEAPPDTKPLTKNQISQKLEELEGQVEIEGANFNQLEHQLEQSRNNLTDLNQEKATLTSEILRLCVTLRNDYCKNTIRADFVAGLRQHDQEGELEGELETGETCDPSAGERNYDEVARQLPVFTISSKAYQQMRSKKKEVRTEAKGFSDLGDTEIPALQAHAKGMSQTSQIMAFTAFLNEFTQLLGTLAILATESCVAEPSVWSDGQVKEGTHEVDVVEDSISILKGQYEKHTHDLKQFLFQVVCQGPKNGSSGAASFAVSIIEDIVVSWHTKLGVQIGSCKGLGLVWNTYKAICRRQGRNTSNPKSRDFNEQILEPYLAKLSNCWELAFVRLVPQALDDFGTTCVQLLQDFHDQMVADTALASMKPTSLGHLERQIPVRIEIIQDNIRKAKASVQQNQRDASRLFYSQVKKQMSDAYLKCVAVTGKGSYKGMKDIMSDHVSQKKEDIYRKAYRSVQKSIEAAFETHITQLLKAIHNVCNLMHKDYATVISSIPRSKISHTTNEQLRKLLSNVDADFEAIVNEQATDIDSAETDASASDIFVQQDDDDEIS